MNFRRRSPAERAERAAAELARREDPYNVTQASRIYFLPNLMTAGVPSSAFALAKEGTEYFGDIKLVCWLPSINWAPIPAADEVALDNKNQTSLLEPLTVSERVIPAL